MVFFGFSCQHLSTLSSSRCLWVLEFFFKVNFEKRRRRRRRSPLSILRLSHLLLWLSLAVAQGWTRKARWLGCWSALADMFHTVGTTPRPTGWLSALGCGRCIVWQFVRILSCSAKWPLTLTFALEIPSYNKCPFLGLKPWNFQILNEVFWVNKRNVSGQIRGQDRQNDRSAWFLAALAALLVTLYTYK